MGSCIFNSVPACTLSVLLRALHPPPHVCKLCMSLWFDVAVFAWAIGLRFLRTHSCGIARMSFQRAGCSGWLGQFLPTCRLGASGPWSHLQCCGLRPACLALHCFVASGHFVAHLDGCLGGFSASHVAHNSKGPAPMFCSFLVLFDG